MGAMPPSKSALINNHKPWSPVLVQKNKEDIKSHKLRSINQLNRNDPIACLCLEIQIDWGICNEVDLFENPLCAQQPFPTCLWNGLLHIPTFLPFGVPKCITFAAMGLKRIVNGLKNQI
jgi:hypothetical protein